MPASMDILAEKASRVRLVCTDVDGVLTDGGMYYSERGDELKKFNTRDGMGVALLKAADIEVAIVTGESTRLVARRAEKLKVAHLFQGVKDKYCVVGNLLKEMGLTWDQAAYIGDDINDLSVIQTDILSATVSDGMDILKDRVDYVCDLPGGGGAFREFAELVLAQHPNSEGKREIYV
jgi:3-deoxy-D-manno-octulosonate 8-phosphate phosphatase (KDO 8-P phosphatase)